MIIKFSQYLNENENVKQTKRKGMIHFQNMKNDEFILWLKQIEADSNGILKNIKCVSKIDGLGARFGRDTNGNCFFEGSRTGPIFDSGAFSKYIKNKTSDLELIKRAAHYDNILEIFKKSSFMNVIPKNTKVVCEIFYNPMAKENDMNITFVTITYDKRKLGSLMSIMPYTILKSDTGEEHPNKDIILKKLYDQSNSTIKIIDPNLKFNEINIKAFIETISVIDDDSLLILKSRKHNDRIAKMNLNNIIQKIKDDLAEYILNHPGIENKFKFGPEIEGIVLWINDKEYKITTKNFKEKIKQKVIRK